MTEGKKYRVRKLCKELAVHMERIEWLSTESPKWHCGAPVDRHTKHEMLRSSQELVACINKYLSELRDPRNIK